MRPPAPPWGVGLPGNNWQLLDGVSPANIPMVSVVVVHFRQQGELNRTLLALQRQTHPSGRLEVIVVDDGSPETPVVPAGVQLLVQPDFGFRASAARNLGAAAATGEILCFLDADTVPEPDYVRQLSRLPALSPEVVTVGRRRHADLEGTDSSARIEVLAPQMELPEPSWLRQGYAASANLLRSDDRSYRYIISAVLACSRWFFDQVGGFDESFAEYGGEDWEWAYRAWLGGAVLAHVPEAIAWHHGPDFSAREMADEERLARTQRETLRLAGLIPVLGSRGQGLRWAHPDVSVVLDEKIGGAAGLICVDAILAQLPDAVVQVPAVVKMMCPKDDRVVDATAGEGLSAVLSRVRIRVRVAQPVRFKAAVLPTVLSRMAQEGLHRLRIVGAAGELLLTVEQLRAQRRMDRWPGRELFVSRQCRIEDVDPVPPDASIAAHFGGW